MEHLTIDSSNTTVNLPAPCPYCSSGINMAYHSGKCPKVKSIEYHPNGTTKKVEFHDE